MLLFAFLYMFLALTHSNVLLYSLFLLIFINYYYLFHLFFRQCSYLPFPLFFSSSFILSTIIIFLSFSFFFSLTGVHIFSSSHSFLNINLLFFFPFFSSQWLLILYLGLSFSIYLFTFSLSALLLPPSLPAFLSPSWHSVLPRFASSIQHNYSSLCKHDPRY